MTNRAKPLNLTKIRTLLTEGFDYQTLHTFCYDHAEFKTVYDQLAPESGKDKLIGKLIHYADQQEKLEQLLAWAKKHNPSKYKKYQPYYDITPLAAPTNTPHQKPQSATTATRAKSHPAQNDTIAGDKFSGDKIVISKTKDTVVAAGKHTAAAGKGGIAISGHVGGDVIITHGDKQIAIPRFVQLAVALIVTLGTIFLVAAQLFTFYPPLAPLAPMTGDFNVAAAQFQVVGQGEGLDEAQALAQTFANAIDREMLDLAPEIEQYIEVRSPQALGPLAGQTEAERAKTAHALAEQINADVIIYGTIEVEGLTAKIRPEFYVRSTDFAAAAEITGQYRLGSVIAIDQVNNLRRKQEVGNTLADISRTLTFIIYGLADLAIGQNETAEANFKQALQSKAWDNPDVIYILLGNTAYRQRDWSKAKAYYQQALDKNPKYARAHAGLASIYFSQAISDTQSNTYDTVDIELLDLSIEKYKHVLDPNQNLDYSPLADTPPNVNFGLGQAYFMRALVEATRDNPDSSKDNLIQAITAFQAVIQDYEAGNNRIQDLAALTHARLGLVYRLKSQFELAINEYKQSLDLLSIQEQSNELRASSQAALGDIYLELGQLAVAIDWYEQAIKNVPVDFALEHKYREKKVIAQAKVVTVTPTITPPNVSASSSINMPTTYQTDTTSYKFNNSISWKLDLKAVAPSYVKYEFVSYTAAWSANVSYGLIFSIGSCFDGGIIKTSNHHYYKNVLPSIHYGDKKSDIHVCGYDEDEVLNVMLVNPLGETVWDIITYAQPCQSGYCFHIEEHIDKYTTKEIQQGAKYSSTDVLSSFGGSNSLLSRPIEKYDFLPGDPLGLYTLEIKSKDKQFDYSFTLGESTIPTLYYSNRLKGFVIAGLEPFEEVWVLDYEWKQKEDFDGTSYQYFSLIKQGNLELDENGVGVLTDFDPHETLLIVSETLDILSTQSDFIPPNYNKLFNSNDKEALIYYFQGLESTQITDKIAGFTQAIKLAPDFLLAYQERANLYEQQHNYAQAIVDYTTIIKRDPNDVSAYEKRARLYKFLNNYDAAIADYNKIIQLNPGSVSVYAKRANLYEQQNNYAKAIADYTKIIQLDLDDRFVYEKRARLYELLNNYDDAIADYNKIIQLDPDDVSLYYAQAHIDDIQGDKEQALANFIQALESEGYASKDRSNDYIRVIELAPDYALAYYKRGTIQDDDEQAIVDFTKAIQLNPDYLWAYKERANLYKQQDNYTDTIADYSKIIELDDSDNAYRYYYARARLYDKQGDEEQALADFIQAFEREQYTSYSRSDAYNRVIELAPDYALAYYKRGKIQEDDEQALIDFTKSIQLDPDYLLAYSKRANLYEEQDNYNDALADYNKIIELDPDNVSAYRERARLYKQQDNYPQAIANYSKIIVLDPNDVFAHKKRANLYELLHNYDNALADYSKIIELYPYDVSIYEKRANLYELLHNYDGAIADYSKIIELKPYGASLYYAQAHFYDKQGDTEQALANFIQALEHEPSTSKDRSIDYTRVIELAPDNALAYYKRGQIQDDKKQAIVDFTQIIQLDPEYLLAYYERAKAYGELNQYDLAIADLTQAIQLDPEHLLAYAQRAEYYAHLGDYEKALDDNNKIIEVDPYSPFAYILRAKTYQQQSDYESAIIDYNQVIEMVPRHHEAYCQRAHLYDLQDNIDQAIIDFERCLSFTYDDDWEEQARQYLQENK